MIRFKRAGGHLISCTFQKSKSRFQDFFTRMRSAAFESQSLKIPETHNVFVSFVFSVSRDFLNTSTKGQLRNVGHTQAKALHGGIT